MCICGVFVRKMFFWFAQTLSVRTAGSVASFGVGSKLDVPWIRWNDLHVIRWWDGCGGWRDRMVGCSTWPRGAFLAFRRFPLCRNRQTRTMPDWPCREGPSLMIRTNSVRGESSLTIMALRPEDDNSFTVRRNELKFVRPKECDRCDF